MRALVLNGALSGDDTLDPIEQVIGATLTARGCSVERVRLRHVFIAYCQGCFGCWVETPGVCTTKDGASRIARELVRSDLLVLLSPITFGGYSSEIKKALDRFIGLVSPFFARIDGEVHHRARYARYPALVVIGVSEDRDPEEAAIFTRLVARNALNFRSPAYSVSIVSKDDSEEQIRSAIGRAVARVSAVRGAA